MSRDLASVSSHWSAELPLAVVDIDDSQRPTSYVKSPRVRVDLRLCVVIALLDADVSALEDTILPLSRPIRGVDGSSIHEVPIPKGSSILIGVLGSNTNKAIWGEDASEWRPERWLEPMPSTISEASIPGVFSNL